MGDMHRAQGIERAAQVEEPVVRDTTDSHSPCSWLLKKIPEDMAKTFTDGQLAAIERALDDGTPRNKAVDIRISVPLLRRRAFLVFLAGLESRAPERRSHDREKHALWTFANVGAFAFFLLFLIPAFMGIGHILTLYLGHAPTSIFWALALLGLAGAIVGFVLARREDSSKS